MAVRWYALSACSESRVNDVWFGRSRFGVPPIVAPQLPGILGAPYLGLAPRGYHPMLLRNQECEVITPCCFATKRESSNPDARLLSKALPHGDRGVLTLPYRLADHLVSWPGGFV